MQRLPVAIFQQDNARPHSTRVSQNCLRTVPTLPWPARFPDLSPIEHIWDHLGLRIGHPTSLNELEARLQQIWNEMFQHIIQNLYASMPDRGIRLVVMVKNSSPEYTGFKPCTATEYRLCRDNRCTIKSVEAQYPHVDVVQSLGEKISTAQVSISPLEQG
ncbi:transposable element Tcb2 transposase [Trichonephila clavipes]|nr:transposable element Tcb2 transposase [Trichonephila clavipes]